MSDERYQKEIKAFGKRIRKLRKRGGMIQLDMDVRLGMNRSEISKIENGHTNIEFFTIVRLAEALGVELYELFTPEPKEEEKT